MDKIDAMDILANFYFEDLNFCACGTPQHIHRVMKIILTHVEKIHEKDVTTVYQELDNMLKESLQIKGIDNNIFNGIRDSLLNILDCAEVIEHGSSIYWSWLTDKGKDILNAYKMLSDDDMEELSNHGLY